MLPSDKRFVDLCSKWKDLFLSNAPDIDKKFPYQRASIELEGLSFYIISWTPSFFCLPHDHGGATGRSFTLRGNLIERKPFDSTEDKVHGPGQIGHTQADDIHQIAGTEDCVSVHIYSIRSESYRLFDLQSNSVWVVKSSTLAWYPEEKDVLSQSTTNRPR